MDAENLARYAICFARWMEWMKCDHLDQWMDAEERERCGEKDLERWTKLMRDEPFKISDPEVEMGFQAMDTNVSGTVSPDEFLAFLRKESWSTWRRTKIG